MSHSNKTIVKIPWGDMFDDVPNWMSSESRRLISSGTSLSSRRAKFSFTKDRDEYRVAVGETSKRCHVDLRGSDPSFDIDTVTQLISDLEAIKVHMSQKNLEALLMPQKQAFMGIDYARKKRK